MPKQSGLHGVFLVLVGGLLGYAAAVGAFDFNAVSKATENPPQKPALSHEISAGTQPATLRQAAHQHVPGEVECCDTSLNRIFTIAQAAPMKSGGSAVVPAGTTATQPTSPVGAPSPEKKPNILVIMGDDIGYSNLSVYSHGMLGYRTPNIDRLAKEGALFTDAYGEQSCTAGRAAFILGQHPFRTGLLTIGMPGSPHGITTEMPTLADLLRPLGYATGHFGKNHLGDRDEHLPTNHGFDEFFGNLYHLNAEEEPEGYFYPKDPAFKKKFGPRGVIHSYANGKIEDTGPLTSERMPTVDEEFHAAAIDFIDRSHTAHKPFFVWYNSTRMHVWTHLKKESEGKTGMGLYADGMVEHDGLVGRLLDHLDKLHISHDTIVIYTTDNGAQVVTWPDGGNTPFHGEKGTTWEGGHRVPLLVRWPGVIQPGTIINDMIAHNDWLPTLVAAAGQSDAKEKLRKGFRVGGKTFKVHLDGYDYLPFFKRQVKTAPRDEYFYFDQNGNLNAARWNDWKVHFATVKGNIGSGVRTVGNWPVTIHLRADPYEKAPDDSGLYIKWAAQQMWLYVPIQQRLKAFIDTGKEFPFRPGSNMNPSSINYTTLKANEVLEQLQKVLNFGR
jgi:arylsulfatase A-like enzyme